MNWIYLCLNYSLVLQTESRKIAPHWNPATHSHLNPSCVLLSPLALLSLLLLFAAFYVAWCQIYSFSWCSLVTSRGPKSYSSLKSYEISFVTVLWLSDCDAVSYLYFVFCTIRRSEKTTQLASHAAFLLLFSYVSMFCSSAYGLCFPVKHGSQFRVFIVWALCLPLKWIPLDPSMFHNVGEWGNSDWFLFTLLYLDSIKLHLLFTWPPSWNTLFNQKSEPQQLTFLFHIRTTSRMWWLLLSQLLLLLEGSTNPCRCLPFSFVSHCNALTHLPGNMMCQQMHRAQGYYNSIV